MIEVIDAGEHVHRYFVFKKYFPAVTVEKTSFLKLLLEYFPLRK